MTSGEIIYPIAICESISSNRCSIAFSDELFKTPTATNDMEFDAMLASITPMPQRVKPGSIARTRTGKS